MGGGGSVPIKSPLVFAFMPRFFKHVFVSLLVSCILSCHYLYDSRCSTFPSALEGDDLPGILLGCGLAALGNHD